MDKYTRKTVADSLPKYDYLANKDDFIEVSEWKNEEGWDITINNKVISLSEGQLDAINYLTKVIKYELDKTNKD